MHEIDAIRRIFSEFPTSRLQHLLRAQEEGRVIRSVYAGSIPGTGCILYQLNDTITSKPQREKYFGSDPELLEASLVTVQSWDTGRLSGATLARVLRSEIARRRELNAQEDATIKRVKAARRCSV